MADPRSNLLSSSSSTMYGATTSASAAAAALPADVSDAALNAVESGVAADLLIPPLETFIDPQNILNYQNLDKQLNDLSLARKTVEEQYNSFFSQYTDVCCIPYRAIPSPRKLPGLICYAVIFGLMTLNAFYIYDYDRRLKLSKADEDSARRTLGYKQAMDKYYSDKKHLAWLCVLLVFSVCIFVPALFLSTCRELRRRATRLDSLPDSTQIDIRNQLSIPHHDNSRLKVVMRELTAEQKKIAARAAFFESCKSTKSYLNRLPRDIQGELVHFINRPELPAHAAYEHILKPF